MKTNFFPLEHSAKFLAGCSQKVLFPTTLPSACIKMNQLQQVNDYISSFPKGCMLLSFKGPVSHREK